MSAAEWIAQRRELLAAATDAPWEWTTDLDMLLAGHEGDRVVIDAPWTVPNIKPADADLIADARTSLPRALDALEAVLALHHPVKIYAQADECGCGDEDHTIIESPQGDDLCWDTPTGELCCSECLDEDSGAIDYPCPTVRAIAEALGVES